MTNNKTIEFMGLPGIGKTCIAEKLEKNPDIERISLERENNFSSLTKSLSSRLALLFDGNVIKIYISLRKDDIFSMIDLRRHLGLFAPYLSASKKKSIAIIDQGVMQALSSLTYNKNKVLSNRTINYVSEFLKKRLITIYHITGPEKLTFSRRGKRGNKSAKDDTISLLNIKGLNKSLKHIVKIFKEKGVDIREVGHKRAYAKIYGDILGK
jgi:hypothetical protein